MSERLAKADKLVRKFSLWAAGAGLIPFPFADAAAVGGAQVWMIHDLAKLYDTPFARDRVKAIIGAVVGGGVPGVISAGGGISAAKAIPVIGPLVGVAVMPALSAAATYALGRVFIQHLEMGGTLLDFDPDETREHYKAEFEAARNGLPEATPAVEV